MASRKTHQPPPPFFLSLAMVWHPLAKKTAFPRHRPHTVGLFAGGVLRKAQVLAPAPSDASAVERVPVENSSWTRYTASFCQTSASQTQTASATQFLTQLNIALAMVSTIRSAPMITSSQRCSAVGGACSGRGVPPVLVAPLPFARRLPRRRRPRPSF